MILLLHNLLHDLLDGGGCGGGLLRLWCGCWLVVVDHGRVLLLRLRLAGSRLLLLLLLSLTLLDLAELLLLLLVVHEAEASDLDRRADLRLDELPGDSKAGASEPEAATLNEACHVGSLWHEGDGIAVLNLRAKELLLLHVVDLDGELVLPELDLGLERGSLAVVGRRVGLADLGVLDDGGEECLCNVAVHVLAEPLLRVSRSVVENLLLEGLHGSEERVGSLGLVVLDGNRHRVRLLSTLLIDHLARTPCEHEGELKEKLLASIVNTAALALSILVDLDGSIGDLLDVEVLDVGDKLCCGRHVCWLFGVRGWEDTLHCDQVFKSIFCE